MRHLPMSVNQAEVLMQLAAAEMARARTTDTATAVDVATLVGLADMDEAHVHHALAALVARDLVQVRDAGWEATICGMELVGVALAVVGWGVALQACARRQELLRIANDPHAFAARYGRRITGVTRDGAGFRSKRVH